MYHEEDPYIRYYRIVKRILILMLLYGIVILNTPECRSTLPGLKDCLRFYCGVIQTLTA